PLVAVIAIVPLVVLMLTSFVKISVVLSLVRNALGAPDAPSALVVMGVSLILTLFVMAPVGVDILRAAADASSQRAAPSQGAPSGAADGSASGAPGELDEALRALVPAAYRPELDAATRALGPLRGFLAKHAAVRDRETFTALATRMGHAVR